MPLILMTRKNFDALVFQQATEACDQIMNEMGAEIHDDLIQKLSIFRLYIDRLEGSIPFSSDAEEIFIKMRTDFENVSQAVRRISKRLMPVKMESESFNTTLELLCQNMENIKPGNIHFENVGVEKRLSSVSQIHLYRIIQELIHNAFKHSSAWHIWVRLNWDIDKVTVEVEDDGTALNQIPRFLDKLRTKYNTLKMRSRLLGASITYENGQKGLRAKVELPIF